MEYKNQLDFIISVFKKSNIPFYLIEGNKFSSKEEDFFDATFFFSKIATSLKPNVLYKYTDTFKRNYRFFLLPNNKPLTLFCLGPFLSERVSEEEVLELCEINGFSPRTIRSFNEYYYSLPVLSENSHLLIMLYCFCETIWDTNALTILDFSKENSAVYQPFSKSVLNPTPNESMVDEKTIEHRYALENQLLHAVSLGQSHLISNLFASSFSTSVIEQRSSNPLQNAKNYSIIMNTLLRKGAEHGGVHPKYINQISSDYAHKIENLTSWSSAISLMGEMFSSYCRLVRKHKTKNYPLIVQKTILAIDEDLSRPLSTKNIAEEVGVSLGYLSGVFKKATGQTVTDYILTRRMEYAEYLLSTSRLQIQTIATHCGIIDTQYFSKLFKKYKGVSPIQFRNKNSNRAFNKQTTFL